MELSIDDLRQLAQLENIEITMHAAKRLEQRGIATDDLLSCIKSGEIIEQYPTDYPFPSCLVLGKSTGKQIIHVVVGCNMSELWIVTAYYPDPTKWETDYRTRKEISN